MTRGPFGKPAADIQTAYQEQVDQTELTTACSFCPWTYTGTAGQGRNLAQEHRARYHPDAKQTRRRRGHLQRWVTVDEGFRDEGNANAAEVAAMHAAREARQTVA